MMMINVFATDDDDVYYYIGERLKLEGETENMGVCTPLNHRALIDQTTNMWAL